MILKKSSILFIPLILSAFEAPSWSPVSTASEASLRGISAVNDRVVWVSGSEGTILKTVDGGAHWRRMQGLPADLDFRAIQSFDGRTVLAMSAGSGVKSTIYRTTDSGDHWTLVHQNQIPEAFFDGFAFFDALRGLLIGDPVNGKFFLLATADGGATWHPIDGPRAQDGEGAFAASNTSLAVRPDGSAWFGTGGLLGGRVFNSYDWGRTWTSVPTPIPHETAAAGVFSLSFLDSKHGYATGGDYQKPTASMSVLSATTDGGSTWHAIEGIAKGYRSAITSDGKHLILTGPGGSEYNGQPIPGDGYHALSIAPKGKLAWASGSKGRVAHLRLQR